MSVKLDSPWGANKVIIGLTGLKGSGKTSISNYLNRLYRYEQISFGGKIKETVMDLFDLKYNQVYGTPEEKEAIDPNWGVSPRFIMQRFGTEVARSIHPDIWVRTSMNKIRATWDNINPNQNFVFDDVRFLNEAEAIIAEGGVIIRVSRPFGPNFEDNHPSESPLPLEVTDYSIINDSGPTQLFDNVEFIMNQLRRVSVK